MLGRVFHAMIGFAFGLVAGVVTTLAVVVARARFEGVYLHDFGELVGWPGFPIVLFPLVGAWLGASEWRRVGPAAMGGTIGLAVGALVGGLAGWLLAADPAWTWAGGILGGATGLVAGFMGAAIRSIRPDRPPAAAAVLLLLPVLQVCGEPPAGLPEPGSHEEPPPERVESVVYFLGDAGVGTMATHPLLPVIQRDLESWAERLGGDGRVAMVVLGDIVYPDGVAAPDARGFAEDSARVADQVRLVAGPAARRHGVRGIFVAGNHDWGLKEEWDGAVRLHHLAELLDHWRGRGVDVGLYPPAGAGGPGVVDIGERLRLILLDTAWWLYDADAGAKDALVWGVEEALAEADGRRTVIAAHHPFRSGGPHGDLLTLGETMGLRTLLSRSGAILQDLSSEPYRELRYRLINVFERQGAPDVFAGGHEHSLQVIGRVRAHEPTVSLVSGSGSKLTAVSPVSGGLAAYSAPGYARLFVLDDGGLWLTLEAAPPEFLACPAAGGGETGSCMADAARAFRTVWAGEVPRSGADETASKTGAVSSPADASARSSPPTGPSSYP